MVAKGLRPHHSASSLVASHNFIGVAGFGVDVGALRGFETTGRLRLVGLEARTLLAGDTALGGSVTVTGAGRGGEK